MDLGGWLRRTVRGEIPRERDRYRGLARFNGPGPREAGRLARSSPQAFCARLEPSRDHVRHQLATTARLLQSESPELCTCYRPSRPAAARDTADWSRGTIESLGGWRWAA